MVIHVSLVAYLFLLDVGPRPEETSATQNINKK